MVIKKKYLIYKNSIKFYKFELMKWIKKQWIFQWILLNFFGKKESFQVEHHETEVQARQAEIDIREKVNEQLQIENNQLIEQIVI